MPARMAMSKQAKMSSRQTQGGTPSRRAHVIGVQYFDVGKVGRKTGITLRDTGLRDDHGLEPMSGIFSSPTSVREPSYAEYDSDSDGSAEMEGLDSIVPDPDETIRSRNLPRLPPARSTPPRRSYISGSPKRPSPGKQRGIFDSPVRRPREDVDSSRVRKSIEGYSPFKPKHTLRRSDAVRGSEENEHPDPRLRRSGINPSYRQSLHSSPPPRSNASSHRKTPQHPVYNDPVEEPLFVSDNEDDYPQAPLQDSTGEDLEGAFGIANSLLHNSPTTPRKRRREEGSGSLEAARLSNGQYVQQTAQTTTTTMMKRPRQDDYELVNNTFASEAGPSSRRHVEEAPTYNEPPIYDEPVYNDNYADDYDDDDAEGSLDLPINIPDDPEEYHESPRARAKDKRKVSPKKAKVKIKEPPRRQRHESVTSDSGSDSDMSRSKRSGSRSNVQLRSTTPFEDATRTSRSGRPIMKPLDWWAGEAVIWKNGEVDGVIRASSVEPEKRVFKKRMADEKKRKQKKHRSGLDAIDERDEDMLPDEWEEDVGVLTGDVAQWNAQLRVGDDENMVTEDLAFASSSIITRSVVGASFSYAKIQTLPFFGSGVVEIPPEGMKSTKNSRKMQMNFFVHKGKVQVVITSPTSVAKPQAAATSTFNITEGGAWVVPRGNNYTIHNLSSTTTAYLFFSQGCETGTSDDG